MTVFPKKVYEDEDSIELQKSGLYTFGTGGMCGGQVTYSFRGEEYYEDSWREVVGMFNLTEKATNDLLVF